MGANADCPCCNPPWAWTSIPPEFGDCNSCPAAPNTWRTTVAGVTDGTSTNCTGFNGTHDIPWVLDIPGTPGGRCNWFLFISVSNVVALKMDPLGPTEFDNVTVEFSLVPGGVVATYDLTFPANTLCSDRGPHTLSLTSSSSDCDTWPATIDILGIAS